MQRSPSEPSALQSKLASCALHSRSFCCAVGIMVPDGGPLEHVVAHLSPYSKQALR